MIFIVVLYIERDLDFVVVVWFVLYVLIGEVIGLDINFLWLDSSCLGISIYCCFEDIKFC